MDAEETRPFPTAFLFKKPYRVLFINAVPAKTSIGFTPRHERCSSRHLQEHFQVPSPSWNGSLHRVWPQWQGLQQDHSTLDRCIHKHTYSHDLSAAWERPKSRADTALDGHQEPIITCDGLRGIRNTATEGGSGDSSAPSSSLEKIHIYFQITPFAWDDSGLQLPTKQAFYRWQMPARRPYWYTLWVHRTFQDEVTNLPKGGTMCSAYIVSWLLKLNFNRTFKNNFSVNHNVWE